MIQFYAPDIATDPVLPESESQHCARVLRMRAGDELIAIDGKGNRYRCRILDPHQRHTMVETLEVIPLERPWRHGITIAVAPTKNLDRMEWLVEKLTEVGVDRIIPVLCQRSERRELKIERLQKIAVSAMKQSLKATLPEILPLTPLAKAVESIKAPQRLIAYCDPTIPRHDLAEIFRANVDSAMLIGPEGDFTPTEIEATLGNGWTPVTLGNVRLRTETAALDSCIAMHTLHSAAQCCRLTNPKQ